MNAIELKGDEPLDRIYKIHGMGTGRSSGGKKALTGEHERKQEGQKYSGLTPLNRRVSASIGGRNALELHLRLSAFICGKKALTEET